MSAAPNFFIVGAARSGTKALYRALASHSRIYTCPIKEPNFFADLKADHFRTDYRRDIDLNVEQYLRRHMGEPRHQAVVGDWETYLRLFAPGAGFDARGEASVSYLWSPVAAGNIRSRLPDARIIVLLRDPAERAVSHYRADLAAGYAKLPFRDAIKRDWADTQPTWGKASLYTHLGRYPEQLTRYFDLFGPDQVSVHLTDDLRHDPTVVLTHVQDYLGVRLETLSVPPDPGPAGRPVAPSLKRRFARLLPSSARARLRGAWPDTDLFEPAPAEVEELRKLFEEDVGRTAELIDRDLSAWLPQPTG